jgi:hypothetical protein
MYRGLLTGIIEWVSKSFFCHSLLYNSARDSIGGAAGGNVSGDDTSGAYRGPSSYSAPG